MHTVKVKMTGYKKTLKRVKKLNKEMKQLSKTAKEYYQAHYNKLIFHL